jgi:hypothetical protein
MRSFAILAVLGAVGVGSAISANGGAKPNLRFERSGSRRTSFEPGSVFEPAFESFEARRRLR